MNEMDIYPIYPKMNLSKRMQQAKVCPYLLREYSGLGDTTVRSFGNRYSGIKETAIPVLETNHIVP